MSSAPKRLAAFLAVLGVLFLAGFFAGQFFHPTAPGGKGRARQMNPTMQGMQSR